MTCSLMHCPTVLQMAIDYLIDARCSYIGIWLDGLPKVATEGA